MPTYEYACTACGHEWEQVQRIVEAPVEMCPKCAHASAHRLISGGTNFILKGGGWYSDLYSSPISKTGKAAAKGAGAAGESSVTKDATPSTISKSEPAAKADNTPKAETKAATSTPSTAPSTPSS